MNNHPALSTTFWQFRASLNEWLDGEVINRYQAELFSLYCLGVSPAGASTTLLAIVKNQNTSYEQ